ncbi:MAG: 1-deoxy-D-xylulose-5-phosphate reductoisomerase [Anaerovoracaceae bacterium]|nr:1-deoxy-D-xylulose-5-phosphate reductoisomerase [Bacillota bacterium]MDY3955050.1 1-deoxy-D-xylulose-5-phosphate reductoisomerase [Anaerovoracaceae bacterium]
MKRISILGSTGSIGTQALDLIQKHPEEFEARVLACGRNIELLRQQIEAFHPVMVSVEREEDALQLKKDYPKLDVAFGEEGLREAAVYGGCDMVLNAVVGIRGMVPTYAAVQAGRNVALANKETLVAGGRVIMREVKERGVCFLPVDSEHSAIFQCLQGNPGQPVKRILLTASGGPFRGYTAKQLEDVTLEQALNHPNWSMGSKITVDSATMMNKGLEVIEAHWLFDTAPQDIQVVVHPESIIHSMVEYEDHAILAQLGVPDMRVPIGYALSYPDRIANDCPSVDFFDLGTLHFQRADRNTFRCLDLAYQVLEAGGSYAAVLNAANEVLVQKFLEKRIKFTDIPNTIERVLEAHTPQFDLSVWDILEIDRETRGRMGV